MTTTYGDAAEVHDNGVVEVFDVAGYLRLIGVDVREGMYGDIYIVPMSADTVLTCETCWRMWDDSISTGSTPVPAGRCPFEYDHDDTE